MNRARTVAAMCAAAALAIPVPAHAAVVGTVAGYMQPHDKMQDQLQGKVCNDNPDLSSTKCTPIVYENLSPFTYQDIEDANRAVNEFLAVQTQPVTVWGYSLGSMGIYRWIEDHKNDPNAPAPNMVTFLVIGDPSSNPGGVDQIADISGSPWQVIQIRRQYEFYTDFPDNMSSPNFFLAVVNSWMGAYLHDYTQVDPDDPSFVITRYGNITDKILPTAYLPLIAWTGPLAPMLDDWLRGMVEDAYFRDTPIPDPTPPTSTTVATQEVTTWAEPTATVTVTSTPTTSVQSDTAVRAVKPKASGASRKVKPTGMSAHQPSAFSASKGNSLRGQQPSHSSVTKSTKADPTPKRTNIDAKKPKKRDNK